MIQVLYTRDCNVCFYVRSYSTYPVCFPDCTNNMIVGDGVPSWGITSVTYTVTVLLGKALCPPLMMQDNESSVPCFISCVKTLLVEVRVLQYLAKCPVLPQEWQITDCRTFVLFVWSWTTSIPLDSLRGCWLAWIVSIDRRILGTSSCFLLPFRLMRRYSSCSRLQWLQFLRGRRSSFKRTTPHRGKNLLSVPGAAAFSPHFWLHEHRMLKPGFLTAAVMALAEANLLRSLL